MLRRVHYVCGNLGTVAELPSLSWLASDRAEAFAGIQQLAADIVADMAETGEKPQSSRRGQGLLRQAHGSFSSELHRQLAIEAADQHVSLNRLISSRIGAQGGRIRLGSGPVGPIPSGETLVARCVARVAVLRGSCADTRTRSRPRYHT